MSFPMNISEQFRQSIEDYLSDSGMHPTTFGKAAMSDPGFVFQVRDGRSCSMRTMDRVAEWIQDNPPSESGEPEAMAG